MSGPGRRRSPAPNAKPNATNRTRTQMLRHSLTLLLLCQISPAAEAEASSSSSSPTTLFRDSLVPTSSSSSSIFHNQFAVLVPRGRETADALASRHGFLNLGQIGALENYFLFEHAR